MRDVTLCYLLGDSHIWLGMKKRGFGEGKWNGFGGKVLAGETIKSAALRELKEEVGVTAREEDLRKVGEIDFYFDTDPDWNQKMHVYAIQSWIGEPIESEEMRPGYFTYGTIPYSSMWIDDPYWLPKVLEGQVVRGAFHFTENGARVLKHELEFETADSIEPIR